MSKKRTLTAAVLALAALAPTAGAQEKQPPRVRVQTTETTQERGNVIVSRTRSPQGPVEGGDVLIQTGPGGGDTFVFVSSEMSIDGKVVKGAPYSAQAVTEMVQMLADGNRIVRRNTANFYRDGEGRTRRDQTIGTIGPFAAQGDPAQTIFINDPVAGVHYILDPRTRSARKLPRFEYKIELGDKDREQMLKEHGELRMKEPGEVRLRTPAPGADMETHRFVITTPGPGEHGPGPDAQFFRHTSKAQSNTEKLPAQTIEGVTAEGTRTTVTIPAGEIGNEQPIQIVTERWYSPELQTVVMTRHSDPRFGENTYKLTNISRAEPAAALFQVPGDYAVKDVGPMTRKVRNLNAAPKKPADQQ